MWRADGTKSQQWLMTNDAEGYWSFQNEGSGLFLTVASDSSHPGEKLIQSTFRNHGGTQQFLVVDSEEYSTLYPKSALGGRSKGVATRGILEPTTSAWRAC